MFLGLTSFDLGTVTLAKREGFWLGDLTTFALSLIVIGMTDFNSPSNTFFEVDDKLVVLESDGKEVKGFVVATGVPFPIGKAIVEGTELSPEEAKRRAVASSAAV